MISLAAMIGYAPVARSPMMMTVLATVIRILVLMSPALDFFLLSHVQVPLVLLDMLALSTY